MGFLLLFCICICCFPGSLHHPSSCTAVLTPQPLAQAALASGNGGAGTVAYRRGTAVAGDSGRCRDTCSYSSHATKSWESLACHGALVAWCWGQWLCTPGMPAVKNWVSQSRRRGGAATASSNMRMKTHAQRLAHVLRTRCWTPLMAQCRCWEAEAVQFLPCPLNCNTAAGLQRASPAREPRWVAVNPSWWW